MSALARDLRYALRALRNAPGFTLVAALTLGLGIGVNGAMVGLLDALLARPPEGVREPAGLVRVAAETTPAPGAPPRVDDALSWTQLRALATRASGLAGVAAYSTSPLPVGEAEETRTETVVLASADYFGVLGVDAALGRVLAPEDGREGAANPVAVLSWDFWQRAFGGDPAAVGATVRVAEAPLTVVGVAPRHFVGAELGAPALWVPLEHAPALGFDEAMMRSPFVSWLSVVARLAPGFGADRAASTARAAMLAAEDERDTAAPLRLSHGGIPAGARVEMRMGGPGGEGAARTPREAPRIRLTRLGGVGGAGGPGDDGGPPVQLWYLAVTAAVLLIACANVANLLLARGVSRGHEMAVRLSLGATRRRLGAQLLAESAVLAALGGAVGLGIAMLAWRVLPAVAPLPPLPPLLDPRPLAAVAGLALATVLLFGMAPLAGLWRPDIRRLLGSSGPSVAARASGRGALVAAQLAVSLVLLVAAGLFIRSFQNVRSLDLGYDRAHLLTVTLDPRGVRGWPEQRTRDFFDAARERVLALPEVRGAALGGNVPFLMRMMTGFSADPAAAPGEASPVGVDYVGPEFFATLGVPVLEGRAFTAADGRGSAPVTVVSRSFAREAFGGASPVGRCLYQPGGERCVEVVGVAGDARYAELDDDAPAFVYRPLEQRPAMGGAMGGGPTVLHVRTAGDPARVVPALRRALRALDPTAPEAVARGVDELVAPQLAPWRAAALLLGAFGALGLALSAVGLYGVVAFLVARRTREIGIRLALGATPPRILRLVLRDAARMAGGGAAAGILLAVGAGRIAASRLFGVATLDPAVHAAAVAVLLVVALAAALVPARRAMRVEPVVALRTE